MGRLRNLAVGALLVGTTVAADDAADGHAWLVNQVSQYNELRPRMPAADLARHLVDETVDLQRFAHHVMHNYVEESLAEFEEHLGRDDHASFVDSARDAVLAALRQRLIDDLTEWLTAGAPQLSVTNADVHATGGSVWLSTGISGSELVVRIVRRDDGSWRVEDIERDNEGLSQVLRERYHDTMSEKYSPAVLEAQLRQVDYVVLEDFSTSDDGALPAGWRWRDRDEGRRKPYQVRRRNGESYLAAQDSGGSVLLLRFAHWNPRQYPIMTWCWRADSLPPGGDERFGHTNDSVAGIYVFFSQTWIGMPRHIKYVWSSTLPEGFVGRRDRIARPYFVVVESGDSHLGQWRFAQVDLEAHYDETWGGRPKSRTQGLGLLSDANSTDSRAEAYYADLRVWTRQAFEEGRAQDYCSCYREPGIMDGVIESSTAVVPPHGETTP